MIVQDDAAIAAFQERLQHMAETLRCKMCGKRGQEAEMWV